MNPAKPTIIMCDKLSYTYSCNVDNFNVSKDKTNNEDIINDAKIIFTRLISNFM